MDRFGADQALDERGGEIARFSGGAIAGVEDLRQKVHGADVSVTQLSAEPCCGFLAHTIFDDMAFTAGHFTGDLRIRGVMAPDAVTLGLILEQTQSLTEWGHETRAGDLLIFPVRGEQEARYRGATRYGAVKIGLDALMRRAGAFEHLVEDRYWRWGARLTPRTNARLRHEVAGCLGVLAQRGRGCRTGRWAICARRCWSGSWPPPPTPCGASRGGCRGSTAPASCARSRTIWTSVPASRSTC